LSRQKHKEMQTIPVFEMMFSFFFVFLSDEKERKEKKNQKKKKVEPLTAKKFVVLIGM
jgi:hypothetical protein